MNYAVVVLFDNRRSVRSVDYAAVTDALLSGGIFPSEITMLAYDAPSSLSDALLRLSACDGVFLVCDGVLLPDARRAVETATGERFTEEYLLEGQKCLYSVLPAGERGAEIVRTETVPRVDARRGNRYDRVVLRTVCAPAEKVRAALQRAEEIAQGALAIHTEETFGNGRVEIIYDRNTPKMISDEVVRVLATELSDHVYSMNDESMAQRLVEALKLHRLRIATAESFTGGGVGREIVRVPGASAVFYEGINAYDAKSKEERLGVSPYTLKGKGAVSDDTAYEMAGGLIAQGNCDVSVATTGIAGPQSDSSGQPAGLCYIAVGTRERVRVFRFHLHGDRETVTETAVQLALFLAYREIK